MSCSCHDGILGLSSATSSETETPTRSWQQIESCIRISLSEYIDPDQSQLFDHLGRNEIWQKPFPLARTCDTTTQPVTRAPSEVGGAASTTSPRSVSPKILFCSKGDAERITRGEKTNGKLFMSGSGFRSPKMSPRTVRECRHDDCTTLGCSTFSPEVMCGEARTKQKVPLPSYSLVIS